MGTQTILSGLASGSLYALMAMALLLIFKVTDILNFAQGDMGALAALSAVTLVGWGVPYVAVVGIALVLTFGVGVLTYQWAIRPIVRRGGGAFVQSVATFGLFLVFGGVSAMIWSHERRPLSGLLTGRRIEILGATISAELFAVFVVAGVISLAAYLYYNKTMGGTAARAVAGDPLAASLAGADVERIGALAWGIGSLIAGVIALLVAPIAGAGVGMLFPFLLKGVVAAVIGGLTSIPGAMIGGLALGMAEAITGVYLGGTLRDAVAVVALLAVLMIRPEGLFGVYGLRKV